jgi:hypothetical protein
MKRAIRSVGPVRLSASRQRHFATGNNLQIQGDLTRRILICQLDAGVKRPETRTFTRDPLEKGSCRLLPVAKIAAVEEISIISDLPSKLPSMIGSDRACANKATLRGACTLSSETIGGDPNSFAASAFFEFLGAIADVYGLDWPASHD